MSDYSHEKRPYDLGGGKKLIRNKTDLKIRNVKIRVDKSKLNLLIDDKNVTRNADTTRSKESKIITQRRLD